MKRCFLFALLFIFLFSCVKEEKPENPLIGTTWYAMFTLPTGSHIIGEDVWNRVVYFRDNENFDLYYLNVYTGKKEPSPFYFFEGGGGKYRYFPKRNAIVFKYPETSRVADLTDSVTFSFDELESRMIGTLRPEFYTWHKGKIQY